MSFDSVPILGVFAATTGLVLFALEMGVRLGRRLARRPGTRPEVSGAMVGASMGLLAFMMAFTFNAAAGRHDVRKNLVVEEALVIEKAWLRAGFLPEPSRADVRAILRDYVDLRLKAANAEIDIAQAIQRSNAMQDRMWALAEEAGRREPAAITVGLFVQALNEVIEAQVRRVTVGVRNRVPPTIWGTLYLLMFIVMLMMGIQVAQGGMRHWGIELALALTFSTALFLVVDLDRPQEGLINVSQQAMVDLQSRLHAK
jgi:hypothetical protein